MALQGSLKELRLGDVFQTILGAGNRGLIRVRKGGQRAVLEIAPQGVRLLEPEVLDERMIVDAFVERGVLAPTAAERARAQARAGATLLDGLVATGALAQEDLVTLLSSTAEDHVLEVLAWTEGEFRFEEGAEPGNVRGPVATVRLEPYGMLLRAAQRIDEQRAVAERIGGNTRLLCPTGTPPPPPQDADDPSPRVHARLDGHTLLEEIGLREGIGVFPATKAACRLVEAGAARAATPGELAAAAKARAASGARRAALTLLRQWQACCPDDPEPFAAAAALAAKSQRFEDECDALKALARVHLAKERPAEAREVLESLAKKRPGDIDALDGLREAAAAMGDAEGCAAVTRRLAEALVEAGDAGGASLILHELLVSTPADIEARVLRSKALVRLADRAQAVEEIERISGLLPTPCRKRAHRDAARFCRDTIGHLAPERTDLLRAFQAMVDPREAGKRRAVIVGGLALALSAIGWALWPVSPAALLDKARASVDAGDVAAALVQLDAIAKRYPDSEEFQEAMALRQALTSDRGRSKLPPLDAAKAQAVRERAEKAAKALPSWPDPAAVADVDAVAQALQTLEGEALRPQVAPVLKVPLKEAIAALRLAAQQRRDALDGAAAAGIAAQERRDDESAGAPIDLSELAETVRKAQVALDPQWAERASAAVKTARRLTSALPEVAHEPDLRSLEHDVESAVRSIARRGKDVERAFRELHRARLLDAHRRARDSAPGALVRGRLEEAETAYRELDALVTALDTDPRLLPLKDRFERRGIVEFSRSRMDMMARMRRGIETAKASEANGDLAGAAGAYGAIVKEFPLFKFDEVFTFPLRVTSVPPGARVSINGREAGRAPIVVRYGWGSASTLTLSAPGFETKSVALRTGDANPVPEIRVPLDPLPRWTQPLSGVYEAPPFSIDGDVVLCDRAGRVERRGKADGEVRWAVKVPSLEGVKGSPAADAGVLWVPLLDGKLLRIDAEGGALRGERTLPGRPVGDLASVPGRIAVATDGAVLLFTGDGEPVRVSLPGPPTAGLLAAHGAFWLGDSLGNLVRVEDPAMGARVFSLGKATVVALAPPAGGVLAITADGVLHAVDASAARESWRHEGLGDAVGRPAEVGDTVAVIDRAGRVRFFAAKDGATKGERATGSEARGGILAVAGVLATVVADGRLWSYDPASGSVVTDAPIHAAGRFPMADLGDGTVAVPRPSATSPAGVAKIPLGKP